MTNTELKAQIDTQITDETVDNSITPTEVGGNMKDTVDYIDQEVLVNKGLIDTNITNISLCTLDADTDVSANAWVLDEDNMASDSNTKVPTQQSVKAYVDASSSGGVNIPNTEIPFGNATGDGLDSSADLTWNGSNIWVKDGFHGTTLDKNYVRVQESSTLATVVTTRNGNPEVQFVKGSGTGINLFADTVTANRDVVLQDKSGTLALLSDVATVPTVFFTMGQAPAGGPLFPSFQHDTFSVGDFDTDPANVRDIDVERTGVGTFEITVRHSGIGAIIDYTKQLIITFTDNKYRYNGVTSSGGTSPGPHNFIKMEFVTYDDTFTIADNVAQSNGIEKVKVELYPNT